MSVSVPLILFLAVICLSSSILFIGSLLNGTDLKYKRFQSPSCGQGLFIIQLPYSEFCCHDNYHSTDWVCMAAYDDINYILSSVFAWTIPIIPIILTMATDLFYGYFNRTQRTHLKRLLFYVIIFVYRTLFLYYVGGIIEDFTQTNSTSSCWYRSLDKYGRCQDSFDYSDHIVLYFTQYLVPLAIELTYVFFYSEHVKSPQLGTIWAYFLPILAISVILFITLRSLFFTSMYFHTGNESVVALEIVFIGVVLPIYLSRGNSYFQSIFLGRE